MGIREAMRYNESLFYPDNVLWADVPYHIKLQAKKRLHLYQFCAHCIDLKFRHYKGRCLYGPMKFEASAWPTMITLSEFISSPMTLAEVWSIKPWLPRKNRPPLGLIRITEDELLQELKRGNY